MTHTQEVGCIASHRCRKCHDLALRRCSDDDESSSSSLRTVVTMDLHCADTTWFLTTEGPVQIWTTNATSTKRASGLQDEAPDSMTTTSQSSQPSRPRQGSLVEAVRHASYRMGGPCESEKELKLLGVLPEPEDEEGSDVRISDVGTQQPWN